MMTMVSCDSSDDDVVLVTGKGTAGGGGATQAKGAKVGQHRNGHGSLGTPARRPRPDARPDGNSPLSVSSVATRWLTGR